MSGATVIFPGDASITTQSLSILAATENFALVQTSASLPAQLTPTISLTTQTALIGINNYGIPIWTVPLAGIITPTKPYLTLRGSTLYIAGLSGITAYGQTNLSNPAMLIVDSTTSSLINYLTLTNTNTNTISAWVDSTSMIWLVGKGSVSNSPSLTIGTGSPISPQTSLANKYFILSSDLTTTTFYAYATNTTIVTLNEGLIWDSQQSSVIQLNSSINPIALPTVIGAPIVTGAASGSDFILMTSSIVYKYSLNGTLLWTVTLTATSLTRINGHRLFGTSINSASLAVGLSSTPLNPGTWVADLDPTTGIPSNIIYGSNLIGTDERLLVATSALTTLTPTVSSSIYIYRSLKPTTFPYVASTTGSPFTFTSTNFESILACPHNTWLALARSGNTVELVHLESDAASLRSPVWRTQIPNIPKVYAPILHPTDNLFALLLPTNISIYSLHTGALVSSRPISIPANLTSAAWTTPTQITATTASGFLTYDLSGDQITTTSTAAAPPSPQVWAGGLSYTSGTVSYSSLWNYPVDGVNVVAAMEARFDTPLVVLLLSTTIPTTYTLVALNASTGGAVWSTQIKTSTVPSLSLNATNILILFPTVAATSIVGSQRFDGTTLLGLDPSSGNISWSTRISGAMSVPAASGLRLLPSRILVRTSTGITYYTSPVPTTPTAQLAVDQDTTLAGSQFISNNGTRNLVIATTAATQTLQIGQTGTSKPVASLSSASIELNAPLTGTAKATMGGGLETTSLKIFSSSASQPTAALIRETAPPSTLTMRAVSSNYYVLTGSLAFPTAPFYTTGTNLMILASRTSGLAATINFGNSIPQSARILESVVAIDVQVASPLQLPVFYDSRGVRCSITTTSPSFASSLYMTYLISFQQQPDRLIPTQRLLQVEGSIRTLCIRQDVQANYVISGAVGTSSVPNLFVTDTSGTTTSTPKGSAGAYVWKAAYGLKTLTGALADLATDSIGGVYVLGNTALTAYDSTGAATTVTTYSSATSAFWVTPQPTIAIIGSTIGSISGAGFVPAAVLPAAPSGVVSGVPALALTPTAIYAVGTEPYPSVLWTVAGISNIVSAALVGSTLSVALGTPTASTPSITATDGSGVQVTSTTTASTPLLSMTYDDFGQSALPGVSLKTAATLAAPLALGAGDVCSGGTISLVTPLTTLTTTTSYSLGTPTTPGQVKVLLAAPGVTATVSLSGRQLTVSGTSGANLIYANSTWYQI